jgi:thymidylate synthase
MPEYIIHNMREGYREILARTLMGTSTSPRGLGTKQLTGVHIILTNPRDSMPIGVGRKINTSIGAVEAAQLIAGWSIPDLMFDISPTFRSFTFRGAYGPRVGAQYDYAVKALLSDPYNRRSQIMLWHHDKDAYTGLDDYPCTTSFQLIEQNGKLECHVHMRSNDAWRGLAYDVFQFTQLQYSIASEVGMEVGDYHHYAVSMHVYNTDETVIRQCLSAPCNAYPEALPAGLTRWQARGLLREAWPAIATGSTPFAENDNTAWYRKALARRSTPQV